VIVSYLSFALIGIIAGGCAPLQTALNARIRTASSSAVDSSLINYAIGSLTLVVCGGIVGQGFFIPWAHISALPWWGWLPGFLGSLFVCGNILLFPILGAVQIATIPLVGQIVASVVIDAAGWFGTKIIPLSAPRVIGCIIVIAGVIISTLTHSSSSPTRSMHTTLRVWLARAAAFGIGVSFACQSAINGTNGREMGSAIHSALLNFVVGTIIFACIALIRADWKTLRPSHLSAQHLPWYVWLGGVLGAVNLTLIALITPLIGTGMTLILGMIGQMIASLVIDQCGLVGAQKRKTHPAQIIGLIIMLAGAGISDL
jgi:transporter family-2 protein